MIDLRKVPHKALIANCDGVNAKYWVIIKNKKYLFKANFHYPDCNTYSNFGEVLYTKLSKKLGFNCSQAQLAVGLINGEPTTGVLIQSYLTTIDDDTMSCIKVCSKVAGSDNLYLYGNTSEAHQKEAELFARTYDLHLNSKVLNADLTKMAIVDHFLAQGDRHEENIEYIFDRFGGMRLAPCFDNGHCLGLQKPSFVVDNILNSINNGNAYPGDTVIYTLKEYPFANSTQVEALENFEIAKLCYHNIEIKNFVNNLLKIDINKELTQIETESGITLDKNYKQLATYIFNNKCEAFKSAIKTINSKKTDLCK